MGIYFKLLQLFKLNFQKLNFDFDDIRTNFFQVLTYYGFSRLLY